MVEVSRHYWDNPWVPANVDDWALRLFIPALTIQIQQFGRARANYGEGTGYSAQFRQYQSVIARLREAGFHRIATWDREEFEQVVRPLGLLEIRWRALQGVKNLAERIQPDYQRHRVPASLTASPEAFRKMIDSVPVLRGAKVGALAGVYLWRDLTSGYNHYPVVPVDDGMARYLSPGLIGVKMRPRDLSTVLTQSVGSIDFEVLLRALAGSLDGLLSTLPSERVTELRRLAEYWETGLERGSFKDFWFAHLALIYQKRLVCFRVASGLRSHCGRCEGVCGARGYVASGLPSLA